MASENADKPPFSLCIASALLNGLKEHKQTLEFSDVQIVVDNFEFRCHRVILAACSGFFKAVFSSGMKEDLERKVILKDISCETFADVLDCIYTARNIVNEKNMFEVWDAANQLQILGLLQECEVFLTQKINNENCIAIYQHSGLLDSKDIMRLSWSYIVTNFESVRRFEQLMMLTAEDMDKLIASRDLQTHSEDHVLETILAWVDYKTPESVDEMLELVDKDNCDTSEQLQMEGALQEESSKVIQHQDTSTLTVDQEKNSQQQIRASNRANYLTHLLKLTRVCLLSGKSLVETKKQVHVYTNKAAVDILQSGLEYMLLKDRRHDFCPASAIHRSTSHLENVIVAFAADNSVDVLVCLSQNGQWYGLGNPSRRTHYVSPITCFDNDVYLANDKNRDECTPFRVFETSMSRWKEIPDFTTRAAAVCLQTIGNFLYAVLGTSEHYSVEVMNLLNASQWTKVCPLPSDLGTINCSTVIGDKIILFGSHAGKSEPQVIIFDTATLCVSQLYGAPSLTSAKVCFSNGTDRFVLEKQGALYRIKACSDAPFIEIVYETMLWDFDREIKGAVLINDELCLFDPSFPLSDTDEHWELSIPGVFKRVKNICCKSSYSGFKHTVIPRQYLTKTIQ